MRLALVTGANRGIGLEVGRQLTRAGLEVVIGARDVAAGEAAAARIDPSPRVVRLDVTDPADAAALPGQLDRLDVLVNNAGVFRDWQRPATETDLGVIRETFEINVLGAWAVTLAVLPLLRASDSARIVNVSSGLGQLSDMGAGSAGYRTSKAALNAMTRILAHELRDDGVQVNSVCPGWVRTDLGGPDAPRDVEQGADTVTWLALHDDDGPTGGFFRDREPIPW